MKNETVTLTNEELEEIVTNSIKRAFTEMGIDSSKPTEMQRDFVHLRRWRLAVDKTQSTTFTAAVVVLVGGIMGALWLGIQTSIGK